MLRLFLSLLTFALLTACGAAASPTPTADAPTEVAAQPSPSPAPSATGAPPEAAEPTGTADVAAPEATAEPQPSAEPSATLEPTVAPTADPASVSIAVEAVASGFRAPVGVEWAGDDPDRFYVVDQVGAIWVVEGGQRRETPFLDLRNAVSRASEQGLLGLAFEPGRPERLYVNYTDLDGDTRIVRYRSADGLVAEAASAEIILTVDQPAGNHNGGYLTFGPDGYLWIGLGDGGGAGDRYDQGQRPETLLGSMLRLDVSGETGYAIPADNPFANGEGGAPEVWAYGLRNPWRYSFDRATGELWVADVGQNQIEEVNRVPGDAAALNYGWPIMEGLACYREEGCDPEGLVLPITQYAHATGGCSITGGYVYRGAAFPALQGLYFFSDYCSGRIWAIPSGATDFVEPTQLLASGLSVSAFAEDPAGELYLTAFDGTVYRIVQP